MGLCRAVATSADDGRHGPCQSVSRANRLGTVAMKGKTANTHDDFVQTYFSLRVALGSLALGLPLALFLAGAFLQGIRLQPSISAYYHSDARDVFVGALWAIGLGLIAYKGFSRREDWALNIGGVLACCVALFPMPPEDALRCTLAGDIPAHLATSSLYDRTSWQVLQAKLHFPAAVSFYIALGFVMMFCSHHTLHLVPAQRRRWYLAAYPALGALFVGSMVAAFVLMKFVIRPEEVCRDRWVFWVEVAGIVPFAAYWFIKTMECKLHDTDRRIRNRRRPKQVEPSPAVVSPAAPAVPAAPSTPAVSADAAATARLREGWDDYKSLWRVAPSVD